MKRILFLLFFATFGSAWAFHHQEVEIVAGSKGLVPEIASLPKPEPGHFGGLSLQEVGATFHINHYLEIAEFKFPVASTLGGEYYTLEYKIEGSEWLTYMDYNDPIKLDYDNASFPLRSLVTLFRLKMHGGSQDGAVSNVVTVKRPALFGNVYTKVQSWWHNMSYNYVGIKQKKLDVTVKVYNSKGEEQNIENVEQYYRYAWYRRNPYTYDMTKIEGADQPEYVTTPEDVGYEIVNEVRGDDEHLSFQLFVSHGVIKIGVFCTFEELACDGFILKTDYILTKPEETLKVYSTFAEELVDIKKVTELSPGRYLVLLPYTLNDRYEVKSMENPDVELVRGWVLQEDEIMCHPVLSSMLTKLRVTVEKDKQPQQAEVDVLGRGIEGDFFVVKTVSTDQAANDTVSVELPAGKYILKARNAEKFLDTYHPSAAFWNEAKVIQIDWWGAEPMTCAIGSLPLPELTGTGVIEGKVNFTSSSPATRSQDDFPICAVYMKKKGSDFMAQTHTNAAGEYRLEHLPFGEYEVLVNLDNFLLTQAHSVVLSEEQPEKKGLDYVVSGGKIKIDPISVVDGATLVSSESAASVYDLQGRKVAGSMSELRTKRVGGIYLQGGRKILIP